MALDTRSREAVTRSLQPDLLKPGCLLNRALCGTGGGVGR
jgi:hypothetical protein